MTSTTSINQMKLFNSVAALAIGASFVAINPQKASAYPGMHCNQSSQQERYYCRKNAEAAVHQFNNSQNPFVQGMREGLCSDGDPDGTAAMLFGVNCN